MTIEKSKFGFKTMQEDMCEIYIYPCKYNSISTTHAAQRYMNWLTTIAPAHVQNVYELVMLDILDDHMQQRIVNYI